MIGPDIPTHLQDSAPARYASVEQEDTDTTSSIGPAIPAHLLAGSARSTTPEEEEADVTEDVALPPSIGPAIPPEVSKQSKTTTSLPSTQDEGDEEEEDYAPALPPDMLAARASGSGGKTEGRRVVGPTLPPHFAGRNERYYDSDDDDYGPAPPPSGTVVQEKSGLEEFIEREERRKKQLEEANKPKALKREEWMLVPPSQSDLLGSIDPTRMKRPRKFAATEQTARDADNSLWTETPAERQQRIADEVAGKRRRVTDKGAMDPEAEREMRKRRRYEEEVRKGVEEHTRKVRGGTLIDQHARTTGSKDDNDEEPPVIWDHSRDMALGGRLMDDKTRNKFITEARGLGDRFGSGKGGGFL